MSLTDNNPSKIKRWIKNLWDFMKKSPINFLIGLAILIFLGLLIKERWNGAFPDKIPSPNSYYNSNVYTGTVNFNSPTSSAPSSISGQIVIDPKAVRTTLSSIFNLLPVILRPTGPTTTYVAMHNTSTLGTDGLYQTGLQLNVLTLPGTIPPILKSLNPPNGIVCAEPNLVQIGVLLGGENTGRTDYEYVINCSSKNAITGSEEFTLNWGPAPQ